MTIKLSRLKIAQLQLKTNGLYQVNYHSFANLTQSLYFLYHHNITINLGKPHSFSISTIKFGLT